MPSKALLAVGILTVIVFSGLALLVLIRLPAENQETPPHETFPQQPPATPPAEEVKFTHLPVNLDLLCQLDEQSGDIPIAPYHCYFYFTTHIEGARKWYFKAPDDYPAWSDNLVKVYLPARGTVRSDDIDVSDEHTILEGEQVFVNTQVDFDLGSGVEICFDHLALRKSIKNEVDECGSVTYEAGTHIGYLYYPDGNHTLDFEVLDESFNAGITPDPNDRNNWSANPLDYFTPELRNHILEKYAPFYDRMVQSGEYPFSDLTDNRGNVTIPGTIWGVWFRDDFEGEVGRDVDPASEAWTIVTLLERSVFNPETYWKVLQETPPISGIMLEEWEGWSPSQTVKLYDQQPLGTTKFYIVSGDNREGVAKIVGYYSNDQRVFYLKFKLVENTSSVFDDKLVMEGFSSQAEAEQSEFSDKAVTFRRTPSKLSL